MGTVFRYSHGLYRFPVLARILAFSGPDTDSTIFRCSWGQLFGTRMDSTFSRYSPGSTVFRYRHLFYHFSVLVGTVFRYSQGFYLFPVLARILSFSGTDADSTIFRYSFGQFFCTRRDSTFSRYSPGFYHFWYSHRFNPFPVLVGTIFGHSHGFYLFPVLARILPFLVLS